MWNVRYGRFVRKFKREKKETEIYTENVSNPKIRREEDLKKVVPMTTVHKVASTNIDADKKKLPAKREFTGGCIVSDDGRFVGIDEYQNIKNPPLLCGVVKNLYTLDEEDMREIGETVSFVNVVLMEHCEWKDKKGMNTKRFIIDNTNLTEVVPNPRSVAYSDLMDMKEVTIFL